ncbi:DUF302 domain-containing protein [Mariniphaga sp.]|uniref:DUF302 domain-containing protein n=1 Tax=Mariniphaga sp. TaxID=1954475 RepID=UPI003563F126
MKGIGIFLTGLIVGIGATLLIILTIVPQKMFVVQESKFNFEETVDAIVETAEEKDWTISHIYDLQESLRKKNFDVAPVYVISLCNPPYANNILGTDEDRMVSAMMPCRVAVYEKGGKTYISMLNAELFARFLSKNAKQTIIDTSKESIEILKPVIN